MVKMIPDTILSRKDEITKDFLSLVDKHISDLVQNRVRRRFHATDFGALLFIHPRHLTNTIKLVTGKSPCDIMEEKIEEEAKKMLIQTQLSIADIASRFAYFEATNFIKFFKSMAGITPLQYRKIHS